MRTWETMRTIVKERSKTQGVTQRFLAGQCGFDEKAFSLIINGRKPITDIIIQKFCTGMNVTPNNLFGLDHESRAG